MIKICICTTVASTIKAFMIDSVRYIHENTDWDISIICDYDEDFASLLPDYINYFPVKMERGISLGGFKAIREFRKIFNREKFDLVQYSTPNAAFYASIAAKKEGIKVRNYHLMGLRYKGIQGLAGKIFKVFEKIACNNSTNIECVSNSNLKMALEDNLFEKEKATVVWNGSTGGVDLQRFDYNQRDKWRNDVREELNIESDDFVYGFVGRITRDKGINEIIDSFMDLRDDCKLLFLGELEIGRDTETFDKIKRAKKDRRIIFHNSVIEIEKYYAAIDVLLLPSYREGFGNVIIEAAAMGTPAIVSNIPGPIDAIVPKETALIVEPKDTNSLYKAMREVLFLDYVSMGVAARDFVVSHFESNELNRYILERKKRLLGLN